MALGANMLLLNEILGEKKEIERLIPVDIDIDIGRKWSFVCLSPLMEPLPQQQQQQQKMDLTNCDQFVKSVSH